MLDPVKIQNIVCDVDGLTSANVCEYKSSRVLLADMDSFDMARAVSDYNPGKILVMNFANAFHPGGGFLSGSHAQEECLCLNSTLYASLSSARAAEMYRYNQEHKNPLDSDYMLLSPHVWIFRDGKHHLIDDNLEVGVLTIPAPEKQGRARNVRQTFLNQVMMQRISNMLVCAMRYGYRYLVLGAWGCGAFGHEAGDVAQCFYQVLMKNGYRKFFKEVVFAVKGDREKSDALKAVFGDCLWDWRDADVRYNLEREYDARYGYFDDEDDEDDEDCEAANDDCKDENEAANYDIEISGGIPSCQTIKYLTADRWPLPVCNHTENVDKHNIGYVQGILHDGVPFEAEFWSDGEGDEEELNISFMLPDTGMFYQEDDADVSDGGRLVEGKDDNECQVLGFHCGQRVYDNGVLYIGMCDWDEYTERLDGKKILAYLQENDLVEFMSNVCNIGLNYYADCMGNFVIRASINLFKGNDLWAGSNMNFIPFHEHGDRPKLWRIK